MYSEKWENSWEENWNQKCLKRRRSKRYFGAFVVIFIGIVILLQRLPIVVPKWLFSWDMIFLSLAIITAIRSRFKHWIWFAFLLLGLGGIFSKYFLMQEYQNLVFPIGLIIFGIYLFFFKANHKHVWKHNDYMKHRRKHKIIQKNKSEHFQNKEKNDEDVLHIENVFGEINRSIISKNFEGGFIKNSFGSTNVNLTKCDINGTVTITIENVFGGTTLYIPTNWKVVSKLEAHLSGVDDKSYYDGRMEGETKCLILRGKSIFGGIEIKNFK